MERVGWVFLVSRVFKSCLSAIINDWLGFYWKIKKGQKESGLLKQAQIEKKFGLLHIKRKLSKAERNNKRKEMEKPTVCRAIIIVPRKLKPKLPLSQSFNGWKPLSLSSVHFTRPICSIRLTIALPKVFFFAICFKNKISLYLLNLDFLSIVLWLHYYGDSSLHLQDAILVRRNDFEAKYSFIVPLTTSPVIDLKFLISNAASNWILIIGRFSTVLCLYTIFDRLCFALTPSYSAMWYWTFCARSLPDEYILSCISWFLEYQSNHKV